MATQEQKYRQAAIMYLVYGVLYLSGGVYLASRGFSERSGLMWFIVGAVFLLVFPPLIWYGFKWFTRVLAVLVLVRIVGLVRVILNDAGEQVPLPWNAELPMVYGAIVFATIAAVTCFMLARAGWDLDVRRKTRAHGAP